MNTLTQQQPVQQAQEKAAAPETKPAKNSTPQGPKIEVKSVKHVFTADERNKFGDELARAIAGLRNTEAELDQVKASFKSRITEAEARIDRLSTDLCGGFEMREQRCQVIYFPKDRKKRYWLEHDDPAKVPFALEEDMTKDDYQSELIQAESKFEHRCEIELFPRTANDFGVLCVGCFKGRWYSALRVAIGIRTLNQRLDSEQQSDKTRWGAIRRSALYLEGWLVDMLGQDNAKGFKEPIEKALNAQKERVE